MFFSPAKKGLSGLWKNRALLVKKTLPTPELIMQEDYATVAKITSNDLSIHIIGVYLQSVTNKPNFHEIYSMQLANISGIIKQFEATSEILMLGDFQCCPSIHKTERVFKTNQLSNLLNDFITTLHLIPVDITNGTGPKYTSPCRIIRTSTIY